jgi:inorganic pyrophosphatase
MTNALDYLQKTVMVQVDRPLGSCHPRHGFVYPLNYGFVPGTLSPDGAELDAYVLGVFEPLANFTGECIAVIQRTNDADDKLVVAPLGKTYSDDQIRALTEFQERFFASVVLR